VAPCGIDVERQGTRLTKEDAKAELSRRFGATLDNKKILTTVGRLVPRKGVLWFVEHVLTQLSEEFVYVVVGDGPEADRISAGIIRLSLQKRVYLFGKVSQQDKELVYDASDLFVMPNQKISGDMEGFGIVALEAGLHNLPVVASSIEGITDAVINGKTGVLVPSDDPGSFVKGLQEALQLRINSIETIVAKHFSWNDIYSRYMEILGINQMPGQLH
jgi:glycosyltransferase involved in cell wall biosynthesis